MTTTDTYHGLHEPVPTHIEDVADCGRYTGPTATSETSDHKTLYEVTLTLQLEADTPEEAADVAMSFRAAIGCEDTDAALNKFGFGIDGPYTGWHLHGPYGC